ncbi:hypothetical protein [Paracoccus lichenicola]|uniref:hypothetical protein n=1 Tax=Paracoccus lichenicola TaxID=2665644 RepID=UPI0012B81BC1|nr:hypothetical protein [Paracoccus lichenicola]
MAEFHLPSTSAPRRSGSAALRAPKVTVSDAQNPKRDLSRIVLPPAVFLHEKEKVDRP